jgi:hypothetical protein
VEHHLSPAHAIAAGLRVLPQAQTVMTSAAGAYRFYSNERISLVKTFEPLKAHALASAASCQQWGLVIHDWSPLHYTDHKSKKDRIVLYNKNDYGYLLQAALLISDKDERRCRRSILELKPLMEFTARAVKKCCRDALRWTN